jgi:hypothetical protein
MSKPTVSSELTELRRLIARGGNRDVRLFRYAMRHGGFAQQTTGSIEQALELGFRVDERFAKAVISDAESRWGDLV